MSTASSQTKVRTARPWSRSPAVAHLHVRGGLLQVQLRLRQRRLHGGGLRGGGRQSALSSRRIPLVCRHRRRQAPRLAGQPLYVLDSIVA